MTVKRTSILLMCIMLCVVALDNFFSIGTPINNTYLFLGAFIASFVLCIAYWQNEMLIIAHKFTFVKIYIILAIVSYLAVFLNSLIKYPAQDVNSTINSSYSYLALLLVYPILVFLLRRGETQSIYKVLDVFSVIIYILVLIQLLLSETNGRLIMLESAVRIRNGKLRIGLHFYGNLMILYNFYNIYYKKNRSVYRYLLLIVGIFELVIIQQTRAYTMVIAAGLFLLVLLQKDTKRTLFKKSIIVFLALVVISQTHVVSSLLQSLTINGSEAGSTISRQYSFEYYWSQFMTNFPFGMCFPNSDKYYSILHHQVGYYTTYVDDVGIVGQIGIWGLFIIPIFIAPMMRWITILRNFKRKKRYEDFAWYTTIFAYLLITSITLIVLDSYRIMMLPIFLGLVEYENYRINHS